MEILDWLTETAYVNRHVSPLYFIIVTIISLSVLVYALRTKNRRAVVLFGYGVVVWVILEFGLFFSGIREYNIQNPYLVITIIGAIEDPGWVKLTEPKILDQVLNVKNRTFTLIIKSIFW
jgi:hypothetical protein